MFLNCNRINFAYTSDKKVLNGISIVLEKGETLAIVGASGCGKSTLLRIISGILPNQKYNDLEGEIIIQGQTTDQYRQTGKLSFMFQDPNLMPNLTVKENIALPLKIKGINDEDRINNLLEIVGLLEYSNYLPKQLSGGMKTRVALSRSFITEPDLLLLDEPFSSLDIAWKSKLYIQLEKLKEKFKTSVIIVTHDVQEALILSDKVAVMKSTGRLIQEENINSEMIVSDRVNDVSGFMKEVYDSYYLPVQKLIMDDGVRAITNVEDVDNILNKISNAAGHEKKEIDKDLFGSITSIRKFSGKEEVNSLLLAAYDKSVTPIFKYNLIWDILQFNKLSIERHWEFFNFYLMHLPEFSAQSAQSWYQRDAKSIFTVLVNKINDVDIADSKKWIYVCDMYASNENSEVLKYLNEILTGTIPQLNYLFAKEVATILRAKFNEKSNSISAV